MVWLMILVFESVSGFPLTIQTSDPKVTPSKTPYGYSCDNSNYKSYPLDTDTPSVCSDSSYCLHSRCIETDRHHHELSRTWIDLVQVSL